MSEPNKDLGTPVSLARVEIIISIDCLPDGSIGFGCHGRGEGDLSEEASDLVAALQETINRFANANGIAGFDCSKPTGDAS